MPQPVAILGDQAWFPPRGPRWIHPTPDGLHRLIGGLASEVVRMCTATGTIDSRLPTQGRGVMGATLHPDGRRLFFGDFDGRLQALDLETGENLWRVETPHASALKWVRVAPGGRLI